MEMRTLWDFTLSFLCVAAAAKSLQSCPTLCDPIDSRPPGSPVPGILQARTLEWVAISFSMDTEHLLYLFLSIAFLMSSIYYDFMFSFNFLYLLLS